MVSRSLYVQEIRRALPATEHLDCRLTYATLASSRCCTYTETVTGIPAGIDSRFLQQIPHFLDETVFREVPAILKLEQESRFVAPDGQECHHGFHRAELRVGSPQENVDPFTKWICFGGFDSNSQRVRVSHTVDSYVTISEVSSSIET